MLEPRKGYIICHTRIAPTKKDDILHATFYNPKQDIILLQIGTIAFQNKPDRSHEPECRHVSRTCNDNNTPRAKPLKRLRSGVSPFSSFSSSLFSTLSSLASPLSSLSSLLSSLLSHLSSLLSSLPSSLLSPLFSHQFWVSPPRLPRSL